ncbi:GNAT family N-acetyltransferase [Planctomycetota bacterium]
MTEIEPLTGDNVDDVYEMCERAIVHHYVGRNRFRMFVLDNPNFDPELALVAREDGKVASFVFAVHKEKSELAIFATDEKYRRKGLAGELYARVETTLRSRNVEEIGALGGGFFSGLDLRYREAAVFLLRRLYTPQSIIYDQLFGVNDVDTDTSAREEKLASEGVTFKRLAPDDAPALKTMLEKSFPGWLGTVNSLVSRTDSEYSVHAALDGDDIVAFAARDGCNFGPTGTAEDYRRRGIGSVVFYRTCRDVASDGHDEMVIQAANFMFYARAFACPIMPVWRSAKDLTADPAIKKAK